MAILDCGFRILDCSQSRRGQRKSQIQNPKSKNAMHQLLEIWFGWVQDWGYLGVIVLMAMESSIFPVPSELVIPPAAFLAAEGKLNVYGVIAAGTFGSWLGGGAG